MLLPLARSQDSRSRPWLPVNYTFHHRFSSADWSEESLDDHTSVPDDITERYSDPAYQFEEDIKSTEDEVDSHDVSSDSEMRAEDTLEAGRRSSKGHRVEGGREVDKGTTEMSFQWSLFSLKDAMKSLRST